MTDETRSRRTLRLMLGLLALAAPPPAMAAAAPTQAAVSPCDDGPLPSGATLTPSRDLYCIFLAARPGLDGLSGRLELRTPHTPFGVAVNAAGNHLYEGILTLEGLPDPASLGDYSHIVAWLATPLFDRVVRLGPVGNGTRSIGEIDFNKFMILVTAEARPDPPEWEGRLLLRATSPSARMSPPDMQEYLLGATGTGGTTGAMGGGAEMEMAGHGHARGAAGAGAWPHPPMMPGLTMFPALMALDPPGATPFLPGAGIDPATLPLARPREVIELADGDEIDLEAGLVRRRIRSRDVVMYGFNGQYPGPLLHVPQATTITVDFTNSIAWPTTIHWHGLRLDNGSDGVPGVTQDPVEPGETFRYEIHFEDPGLYWYHPHHREDILKDLGLYGNMLVEPGAPDYYAPADREAFLMLDDVLMTEGAPMPFGRERSTHSFMGRFGNLMLVNGEPDYEMDAAAGEVVRLYLTNVSNTRTFNLSFATEDGLAPRMKVVGADVGAFEREEWVKSIVLSPAERYIVHVRFDEAGRYAMLNRVQGIDHLGGAFFQEEDTMGAVRVTADPAQAARPAPTPAQLAFDTLRTNLPAAREIALYREHFGRPVDHELTFTVETGNIPFIVDRLMRFDSAYFHPVEWSGTMPMMNWNSSSAEVTWIVRDPATGAQNMDIDWTFEVGDVVKIRLHNERRSFHAMQHPFHNPRPALPGAGAQRRPQREPGLEGHGAAPSGHHHRHPSGDHEPGPLDGALPHLGAPGGGDADALHGGSVTAWKRVHEEAVRRGEPSYVDPDTGYHVFTEVGHRQRGRCCGSGCRHCPYEHEAVPRAEDRSRAGRRAAEPTSAP